MARVLRPLASNRAAPEWRDALRLAAELDLAGLPPDDPFHARAELPVAVFLREDGDFAEAGEALERSRVRAEALADVRPLRDVARELARLRCDEGHDDEAEAWVRRAVDLELGRAPAGDGLSFWPFSDLKQLLVRQGRFAEAADVHARQLEALASRQRVPPLDFVLYLVESGDLLRKAGRVDDAACEHRRALEAALASFPEGNVAVQDARRALATTLLACARRDEAITLLRQAEAALVAIYGPDHAEVADVKRRLREAAGGR